MTNNVDLRRVQTILKYDFHDVELLLQALTAADKMEQVDGTWHSYENNRRLGKIGEAMIKLVLTEDWYNTNEPLSKAFLIHQAV